MPKFLDGIVVLDFSRVLAGPFCTMTLADIGARVIKVESPDGDEARGMGPFVEGNSLYFAGINRSKESVVLNLKTPDGLKLARRLCQKCDVLVENYRPGTMDKLGLGYDDVRKLNPSIVYASLSGFGHSGTVPGPRSLRRDNPGNERTDERDRQRRGGDLRASALLLAI